MAALVALGFWIRTHPLSPRGLALLAAFCVCCFGMLITGGRGPTLSLVAVMFLPLALGIRLTDRTILVSRFVLTSFVLTTVLALVVAELAISSAGNFRTIQRFGDLFSESGGGLSASKRLQNWREAALFWFQQPVIGHGNGSWPIIRFGVDTKRHPHNLVLEVLTEYGIVGLVLLAAVVIVACSRITLERLRDEPLLMCAAMLAASAFLSALTTSDITENRALFAMLGLLAMPAAQWRLDAQTEGGPCDVGAPGQRHPDLHEAVPDAGRGRI